MNIDTTALDDKISHLESLVKIHDFEKNPRGRGNLARQHLFHVIKTGQMDISEFNRRFASILTYEVLNRGEFDIDTKNKENLAKLRQARVLIKEVEES